MNLNDFSHECDRRQNVAFVLNIILSYMTQHKRKYCIPCYQTSMCHYRKKLRQTQPMDSACSILACLAIPDYTYILYIHSQSLYRFLLANTTYFLIDGIRPPSTQGHSLLIKPPDWLSAMNSNPALPKFMSFQRLGQRWQPLWSVLSPLFVAFPDCPLSPCVQSSRFLMFVNVIRILSKKVLSDIKALVR